MKAATPTFPTLIETIYPSSGSLHDSASVIVASLFIAVCAQVNIPLPFTPVPLSGGTLGVLYTGALLGSRRGAVAVLLYLLEGSAGLPFFSGGAAGFVHLLGPTGGYLAGFPVGAFVTGLRRARLGPHTRRAFARSPQPADRLGPWVEPFCPGADCSRGPVALRPGRPAEVRDFRRAPSLRMEIARQQEELNRG